VVGGLGKKNVINDIYWWGDSERKGFSLRPPMRLPGGGMGRKGGNLLDKKKNLFSWGYYDMVIDWSQESRGVILTGKRKGQEREREENL